MKAFDYASQFTTISQCHPREKVSPVPPEIAMGKKGHRQHVQRDHGFVRRRRDLRAHRKINMLSLITANFKDQVEPDSTVTTGLPREIEKIKQQVSNHVFKCEIARLLKYYMKAIGHTFHGFIGV